LSIVAQLGYTALARTLVILRRQWVKYAPHPYDKPSVAKVVDAVDGKEVPLEKVGPAFESFTKLCGEISPEEPLMTTIAKVLDKDERTKVAGPKRRLHEFVIEAPTGGMAGQSEK